jgi:hypothetical protein
MPLGQIRLHTRIAGSRGGVQGYAGYPAWMTGRIGTGQPPWGAVTV